ncbi:hypothetical protein V5O48_007714 [Marasmius crinis-equi]|uniref:Enoyl reductase (ER) domain-containing protein n=1 Tax=Marasmius crinis-equi TaxID=585013 RepID=A0ABR3FGM5_9AGAR
MRALVSTELAHHSKATLTHDAPDPTPLAGQVLVDVYSAGLNFFDDMSSRVKSLKVHRYLKVARLSEVTEFLVPGRKDCRQEGIITLIAFDPTDPVFFPVPANEIAPLPDNLTYDEGAGLYVTFPTTYEGLVGRANLKPGEWVLVTAAAGGIGMSALQLARILGGRVIAAAGSQDKMEIAKRLGGADYTVNYKVSMLSTTPLDLFKASILEKVVQVMSVTLTLVDSFKCIAFKGRTIVVGFSGGIEKVPTNLILLKNISVLGIFWGAYRNNERARIAEVWRELLEIFKSGKLKPVVNPEVYSLERVTEGLSALEHRKTWGKVIARVREENATKSKL